VDNRPINLRWTNILTWLLLMVGH